MLPPDTAKLQTLPGIGHNTAAAIVVYAYNQLAYFIETNVRTVYIHHFFADADNVADSDIMPYLEATIDTEQPCEFYWALMDYGSRLKATIGNPNHRSKHYAKQSRFEGSLRQIRGQVIRQLTEGNRSIDELSQHITDERLTDVLTALIKEGLIQNQKGIYGLGR